MTDAAPYSPDMLTAALRYAGRGWRVLPVIPGEKRPSLARWPELATTDPHQVADWWIDKPDSNVGLATGRGSGFFVLDVDPKNGGAEALTALEAEHQQLPPTYAVRTGSGGWHYYFQMPDFEVTNSPGSLRGTGIDVRGEGGQVLAPPSVTALGSYSLVDDYPLAEAPAWLLGLLRPRPALSLVGGTAVQRVEDDERVRQYVHRAFRAACDTVAEAAGGERNQTLNDQVLSLAGIAAHDPNLLDKGDVYADMHQACQVNGYLADDGVSRFAATFESAWKAGLTKPRRDWPPVDRTAGIGFADQAGGLPVVNVTARKHNELTDEIMENLAAANQHDPRLFTHGSEVVQIVGPPARTEVLDTALLGYEADVAMHFERRQPNGGVTVANAPAKILETILALHSKPFPPLERISHTPFFSPSGAYISRPGYDAESRTFYSPHLGTVIPPVPEAPSPAQVRESLEFVCGELLGDFPFATQADRAHAVALMLLPFVRDIIDGPTPLHDIESPTPGSGKGLLMKTLLTPGIGGRHVTVPPAANEEEWQKSLLSFIRLTPQALVIDNVNAKVASGFLCTCLTEPEVTARMLGVSAHVTVPIRAVWVMTANNPRFSDEVARRTIRIRIDAQVERPEDRTDFRHPDLLAWAIANRGRLIAACCTMVQGWVGAGMPEIVPRKPLGSFERWHAVMGGLLDYLGVEGLLANKEEFLSTGDDEANAWSQLVALLRRDLAGEWSAADIGELVTAQGIAIDIGRGDNKALMMGRELAKQRDRWHDGFQFHKRVLSGRTMWRLVGKPNL